MSTLDSKEKNIINDYLTRRRTAKFTKPSLHKDLALPKIEKDVPIPTTPERGGARCWEHFYPFEAMQIGDSFWIPSPSQPVREAVTKFAAKTGWKFTTRAQSRDGVQNSKTRDVDKGIRVWRVG